MIKPKLKTCSHFRFEKHNWTDLSGLWFNFFLNFDNINFVLFLKYKMLDLRFMALVIQFGVVQFIMNDDWFEIFEFLSELILETLPILKLLENLWNMKKG